MATAPAQPALTSEGLCRPPPEAGGRTFLSEQWILPPLQGLLGLIAQLQVGLRDCREHQRHSGPTNPSFFHPLVPQSQSSLSVKEREGRTRKKILAYRRSPGLAQSSPTLHTPPLRPRPLPLPLPGRSHLFVQLTCLAQREVLWGVTGQAGNRRQKAAEHGAGSSFRLQGLQGSTE